MEGTISLKDKISALLKTAANKSLGLFCRSIFTVTECTSPSDFLSKNSAPAHTALVKPIKLPLNVMWYVLL